MTGEVMSERLSIEMEQGTMPAFLVRPEGQGPFPGIILAHDIYGLVTHTEDVATRLAEQGYATLAPNLFWHLQEVPELTDRESFLRFRAALHDPTILGSLESAFRYLRDQSLVTADRIGIMGFCMGAYYAFHEAAQQPALAACVDFYGAPIISETSPNRPRTQRAAARDLRVPFLGLYGADDQSIPVAHVRELEKVLREGGVSVEIHVYPNAGHAFFSDTSPTYRPHAAEDAWPRALQFLDRYLKRPG